MRAEVPWLDRPPADIIRERVRFTLTPLDLPPDDPQKLIRTLEHIGSDELLLFSTDYPHWHFDGDAVLPDGLSDAMIGRFWSTTRSPPIRACAMRPVRGRRRASCAVRESFRRIG